MKKLINTAVGLVLLGVVAFIGWKQLPSSTKQTVSGGLWSPGGATSRSGGAYAAKARGLKYLEVTPRVGETQFEMIDVESLHPHRHAGVLVRMPYEKPQSVQKQGAQVTLSFPRQTQLVITRPEATTSLYAKLKSGGARQIDAGRQFLEVLGIRDEGQFMERMLNVTAASIREADDAEESRALYKLAQMKSGFLEMMSASTSSSQGPSPRRFEVDRRVAWVFGDPAGSGAAVEMIDPDGHHLEFYVRGSEVELQTLVATARRVE